MKKSVLNRFSTVKNAFPISLPPKKRVLKHSMIGLEAEFFIIDDSGNISHSADDILERCDAAKKECSKNLIEINSDPSKIITGAMGSMLDRTELLVAAMEKSGNLLYACGTYPGSFNPSIRGDRSYEAQGRILGRDRFKIAGRCAGFHCHYTLPRGMFDRISKRLNIFLNSRVSRSFVGSYNMMVAMEPVFSTFSQSSPFYQGKLYGKSSRTIFYRGGRVFGQDGLYGKFQEFGGLPSYKHTIFDIMHLADNRFREWTAAIKGIGMNMRTIAAYGSVLDTDWSPIKINPQGTMELRGMDMNRFDVLASLAVSMKFLSKHIHDNYTSVVESDTAIREPFKVEGNRILIPPHGHLYHVLQRESALYGMGSDAVRDYCSRFLKLSSRTLPADRKKFLRPLKDMVDRRSTMSDDIISMAKHMGYVDSIPRRVASEIALKISDGMQKDIDKTRRLISGLS